MRRFVACLVCKKPIWLVPCKLFWQFGWKHEQPESSFAQLIYAALMMLWRIADEKTCLMPTWGFESLWFQVHLYTMPFIGFEIHCWIISVNCRSAYSCIYQNSQHHRFASLQLYSVAFTETSLFEELLARKFKFPAFFQANGIKIGPQHSPANPNLPSGSQAGGSSGGCC